MWTPRVLTLVTLYQIVVVAVLSVATYFVSPEAALAVFLGGGFGTLNFWSLRTLAERTFEGEGGRRKVVYAVFLGLKTVLALGVIAGLFFVLKLHPLGFALGLSTMFLGIGLAVGHTQLSHKTT